MITLDIDLDIAALVAALAALALHWRSAAARRRANREDTPSNRDA